MRHAIAVIPDVIQLPFASMACGIIEAAVQDVCMLGVNHSMAPVDCKVFNIPMSHLKCEGLWAFLSVFGGLF